jgi:ankyrin repeat protein
VTLKADPACRNHSGADALQVAIIRGHDEAVRFLLEEAQAPAGQADELGRTALHVAAKFGWVVAVGGYQWVAMGSGRWQ